MIAHLDASTGVSGDKLLSALIDAGADREYVREALSALDLGLTLEEDEVRRRGVRALAVRVRNTTDAADLPPRDWAQIRRLLSQAPLDEAVAGHAMEAFSTLAEAEGEVHGIPADEVHFHEVGALDAIGEIVGVAAAFEDLGIEHLTCSAVALGSGTVECAHGTLPVPAPATALLSREMLVTTGEEGVELTTPTGAALLAILCDGYGKMPTMRLVAVGSGAGDRDTHLPNIIRLFVGEPEPSAFGGSGVSSPDTHEERIVMLVTNVDHLTGEQAAFVAEDLREAGALDVTLLPVVMKKGRPGLMVEVMCDHSHAASLAERLMQRSGSLGVRVLEVDRLVAARETVTADTEWGPVRVKVAHLPEGPSPRAEYEDCAGIAREHGIPIELVARVAEENVSGM